MKKLLAALVILLGATSVFAPTAFAQQPVHEYWAADFAQWSVQGQTPNVFLVSASSLCQFTADGISFFPFNTNAPVLIADSVTTNSEIVTPTTAVNRSGQCGITASPANSHYSFQMKSGTGGLQEALNALGASVQPPNNLYLGVSWYALANNLPSTTAAAVLAAAKGSTAVTIVDTTTAPFTFYSWTGTQYVAVNGSVGGITAPTLALSTGAGTSPTLATIVGNGGAGVVTFKTGTSPSASATIFTLTWPVAASGGFARAPVCTITGVQYNSQTQAGTYTPPALETVTASSTALTAATTYNFRYDCK